MNLGTAIKELRKKRGITQKALAEMANISANALNMIESNENFPQKGTLKAICEALNVPVAYLLFMSIDEEDIPEHKKLVFKSLHDATKAVLLTDLEEF
jgi:XRE family transcriptional regulator, regulator of sulfur utilization